MVSVLLLVDHNLGPGVHARCPTLAGILAFPTIHSIASITRQRQITHSLPQSCNQTRHTSEADQLGALINREFGGSPLELGWSLNVKIVQTSAMPR